MLKSKSKLLALFLMLVLLFNLIMPIISNAADQTSIGLVNAAGEGKEILVSEGETFEVNVEFKIPLENALSLAGVVKFDDTKLELVNKVLKEDTTYAVTGIKQLGGSINFAEWDSENDSDTIAFAHSSDYGSLKEGTSLTLEFKVKDGARGTFDISIEGVKYSDAKADETQYPILQNPGLIRGTIKVPLESISLNKTETTLGVGSSEKLAVTYNPAETTDSKTVEWTSDTPSVATVDANGKVTAVAPGDAIITATCGDKTATCKVNVTLALQSISINKSTVELEKGQTEQLAISYNPSNTTDSKEIDWTSSKPDVATVDQNGLVTAKTNGTTVITAKSAVDGIKEATCTINVVTKLQSISLDKTNLEMNKGTTQTLKVSYNPVDATNIKTTTWTSSDESVAKVVDGTITAVKPGNATIYVSCNGFTAQATVNVKSYLESISIGEDFALDPSQEQKLIVTYNPTDTTDSKTVTWISSNPEVATVDAEGNVKALTPGNTIITATCGKFSDDITLTVNEVPMEGIAISTPSLTINRGESQELKVIFYPENTTDDRNATWASSDESVVKVENGVITAVGAGKATIEVTVGEYTDKCEIEVKVPITGISMNSSKVSLVKGDTATLQVNITPVDTTDDTTIAWSSKNEDVATVDENGVVTAVGAGNAIIEAKVGEFTTTCEVEVNVPLTGIEIKDSTTLIKNQSEILTVTYLPEDTTSDKTVTWTSSDETVAVVDENGKVTGLKEGKAVITAKVGEFTSDCTVEVKEIKLEGIAISNKLDVMYKQQYIQLEILYTPENTTDDKTIEWSSSDETVATVSETGHLLALKQGTTTITAKSGNLTDSFELTVKEIPLTALKINAETQNLKVGESLKLEAEFIPNNSTEYRTLEWTSSDESIITVDNQGNVTAVKPGKAIVTAVAYNGVKTQIELTVEEEDVTTSQDNKDEGKEEEKVESPQTGDINIAFYIGLMIVSLVGIIKSIKRK